MYIARTRSCAMGCAKPCEQCVRWIKSCAKLGVHLHVWYSDNYGNIVYFDWNNDTPHRYKLEETIW